MNKCSCGSDKHSYWVNDAQGITLCKVCDDCEEEKLSHYRLEILSGYDQSDVNESIEEDYLWLSIL